MIIEDKITELIENNYGDECEVAKSILYFHLLNSKFDINKKIGLVFKLYVIFAFSKSQFFNTNLLRHSVKKHRLALIEKSKHRNSKFIRDYEDDYKQKLFFNISFLVKLIKYFSSLYGSDSILSLLKKLNALSADCIHEKNVLIIEGDTPLQKAILQTRRKNEFVTLVQWGSLTNACIKSPFKNFHGISVFIFTDKTFVRAMQKGHIKINSNCRIIQPYNRKNPTRLLRATKSLALDSVIILDQGVGGFIDQNLNDQFYSGLYKTSFMFPDLTFFIRPHPENNVYDFKFQKSDNAREISTDLKKANLAISIASSALIEALEEGVIPVSYFPHAIDYRLSLDLSTDLFDCHPIGTAKLVQLLYSLMNAPEEKLRTHFNTVYERYF